MIVCPWKDIKKYAALLPGLDDAVEAINGLTEYADGQNYPLPGGNRFSVMVTRTAAPGLAEAHREFLDVHYIIKGKEVMGWADLAACQPEGDFDESRDVGMYTGHVEYFTVNEGMCYVVFPEDIHMPARHLDEPNDLTKIVVKLKV